METHKGGRGADGEESRTVLIGTEDRGQEERRRRREEETGSPQALRWPTLLNDASLS